MEGRVITADEKAALFGAPAPESSNEGDVKKEEVVDVDSQSPPVEKVEQDVVEFDINSFSKKFGRDIKEESEIISLFEKADKLSEYEASNAEMAQKMAEMQSLLEKVDPMDNFLNEDEYLRQQFLKRNSDKMTNEGIKALSALSPSKIGEMKSIDALRVDLVVNEGLTGEEADAYLMRHYDLDDLDSEEMDAATRASIKVDVKNAKKRLSDLYQGIDIPTKVDFEAARTQLKESWSSPLDQIVKGIDKIQLEEGFDFVVTDDMKQGLFEETLSEIMIRQLKPGQDSASQIVGAIKDKIVLRNIDKVVKSLTSDIREKIKAEVRAEIHNDKPLNNTSRSATGPSDNDSKMRSML